MKTLNGPPPLLTQQQVDALRQEYTTGKYTMAKLATKYNISEKTTHQYLRNKYKKGR